MTSAKLNIMANMTDINQAQAAAAQFMGQDNNEWYKYAEQFLAAVIEKCYKLNLDDAALKNILLKYSFEQFKILLKGSDIPCLKDFPCLENPQVLDVARRLIVSKSLDLQQTN